GVTSDMEPHDSLAAAVISLVRSRLGVLRLRCALSDAELEAAERALAASLPQSYLVFLRHFGSRCIAGHDLLGLPRDGLSRDIVLRNELVGSERPAWQILFATSADRKSFYFDTRRMSAEGECPVVVREANNPPADCAKSFLEYLKNLTPRFEGQSTHATVR